MSEDKKWTTLWLVKGNEAMLANGWHIIEVPRNPTKNVTLANHDYRPEQMEWIWEHVSEGINLETKLKDL
jgi:hypothetical protein